jgi:hypothetical protein
MLKLLKRWLGWEADSGPFDFSDLQIPFRNRSKPAAGTQPDKPRAPQAQNQPPPVAAQRTVPPKPKKKRAPMDVLDNPSLTLDKPDQDGFDPYNTGAFNRSTSWEKIGRQKKR